MEKWKTLFTCAVLIIFIVLMVVGFGFLAYQIGAELLRDIPWHPLNLFGF